MQRKTPHIFSAVVLVLGSIALFGLVFCVFRFFSFSNASHSKPQIPPAQSGKDEKENAFAQHIVALDPGHGGMDPGASELVREVDVCEATVDALYALLEKDPNYHPLRTRSNGEDKSIRDRFQAVNQSNAEVLLSIHANCDNSTRQSHGFECFPQPPGHDFSQESLRLASLLSKGMGDAGHRLRGENGIRFAYYDGKRKIIVDSTDTRIRSFKSFGIIENSDCPAVLIEQCFLTNYNDVENWAGTEGCQRAARIYYEALCQYFGTDPLA